MSREGDKNWTDQVPRDFLGEGKVQELEQASQGSFARCGRSRENRWKLAHRLMSLHGNDVPADVPKPIGTCIRCVRMSVRTLSVGLMRSA
jgi:hypothetical protein